MAETIHWAQPAAAKSTLHVERDQNRIWAKKWIREHEALFVGSYEGIKVSCDDFSMTFAYSHQEAFYAFAHPVALNQPHSEFLKQARKIHSHFCALAKQERAKKTVKSGDRHEKSAIMSNASI